MIKLYMFVNNHKGWWSMIVRLAFIETLPGNTGCLTTGRAACVHPCVWVHLALMSIPRWHHHLLPVEVLSGPSKAPRAHTQLPVSSLWSDSHVALNQMTNGLCTHAVTFTIWSTNTKSLSIFPLFFEVHIGSIKALKESVSLSVLPSVSLCAIWPSLLPWIENIGAHLHYQQFICVSVCACVFRRQLKNSLEGCQMAGVCGDVLGGGGEMMGADEGKDRRKHKEAKTAAFSALQLLFSQIITLHPLTPKTKGTPPVWKHE